MSKAHSHILRKRYYAGESEATGLADWLNEKGESESKRRISELLRNIHEFHMVSEPGMGWTSFQKNSRRVMARMLHTKGIHAEVGTTKPSKELRQRMKKHLNLYSKINRQLASYSMIPAFNHPTEFGWTVEWRPISHPINDYLDRTTRHRKSGRPLNESLAVLDIAEISKLGLVTRIRNCSHCGKWFFARFRHQQFCGEVCQQAHYWKSETGKAQRREYMRRYRRVKSLPNVK